MWAVKALLIWTIAPIPFAILLGKLIKRRREADEAEYGEHVDYDDD